MSGVWKSPAEWAALELPGLPGTERGIQLRAERDSWPRQRRDGKQGGGWEYPLSALPEEAREAYLARAADAVPALPAPTTSTMPAVASGRDAGGLADWQRRCMDARAAILMEVERLAAIGGQAAAMREVIARAADGRLRSDLQALVPVANAKAGKDGRRTLSRATLFRWKQEAAAAGATALAPRSSSPAQSRVPAWAPALLKLYRVPTTRSLAAVMEDLPAALPPGVAVPSYAAARRWLQSMSTVDRERGRHGPNGLLKFKAFKRRSTDALEPMDVVSADGHTFKADVAHPVHQRRFRPETCAVIDVATRYAFGWSAGLAESSLVVMDCIRHGVERLGQFALFYTDNGAGFVAEALTAEVTGLLGRIGATPINSIAGRAQARGKIERFQATVWKRAARKLPTYSGRDMDNEARRKVVKLVDADIKARGTSPLLMSWSDFLVWAQGEIDAYNNRPHRGLAKIRDAVTGKMRHMSPAECLMGWIERGWEPSRLPSEIMDSLFRPEIVKTTSRGEVTLPWGRYFNRELEHWTGERVRVAYDIHDGGRVWVRTLEDGRLICIAERDANVIPEQPASKVEHARRTRETARLKLLEQHAEEVRAEAGPGLIEYQPAQSMEIDAAQATLVREMEAAARPAPTIVVDNDKTDRPIPSDPDARVALWCDVDERVRAGGDVGERLGRWHEIYQTLPEFRARWQMWTEFGVAPPNSAAG